VWVISERVNWGGRARAYTEDPDPRVAVAKVAKARVRWCSGEKNDPRNPNKPWNEIAPQLYNLDAAPYESLMLGQFAIWQGPQNSDCAKLMMQKRNEILLGYSRDGFHWHRPDRRAFIPAARAEGTWDRAYLHSTAGVCLIDGDRLLFPYCAFSGIAPDGTRGVYHGASVGLDGRQRHAHHAPPPLFRLSPLRQRRRCRHRRSPSCRCSPRKRERLRPRIVRTD